MHIQVLFVRRRTRPGAACPPWTRLHAPATLTRGRPAPHTARLVREGQWDAFPCFTVPSAFPCPMPACARRAAPGLLRVRGDRDTCTCAHTCTVPLLRLPALITRARLLTRRAARARGISPSLPQTPSPSPAFPSLDPPPASSCTTWPPRTHPPTHGPGICFLKLCAVGSLTTYPQAFPPPPNAPTSRHIHTRARTHTHAQAHALMAPEVYGLGHRVPCRPKGLRWRCGVGRAETRQNWICV